MYDELVKMLRKRAADWVSQSAADAIEELQKRVPKRPHGRLIDADALPWDKQGLLAADEDWALPCSIIENAPTVIEAEAVYSQYTDTAGNYHWCGTHSGEHTVKVEDSE